LAYLLKIKMVSILTRCRTVWRHENLCHEKRVSICWNPCWYSV